MPPPEFFNINTVLLVADLYSGEDSMSVADQRRDLEKSSMRTVASIMQGIEHLGLSVIHIQSLEDLSERAAQQQPGDLVLSIYGGQRSRNRMALVPAICEAFDLRFVGPDVYGRIVCQDKEISKRLALECGVLTPRHYLIRGKSDLGRIAAKRFPLVVKPNFEGSSIGISKRSLVQDMEQLREVAAETLNTFAQPVLIEEFIPGQEVCYSIIEENQTVHGRLAEIRLAGRPAYFDENLFCAEEKSTWKNIEILSVDDKLTNEDRNALHRLVEAVGHVGYCRVDGKLHNGRFHFLELTPDAWLDPAGAFPLSFTNTGWTYPEFLAMVLASECANHPHQSSSG